MEEQGRQIANYLLNLISNNCTIPANQAESIVATKQFLQSILNGQLVVGPPSTPPPPVDE